MIRWAAIDSVLLGQLGEEGMAERPQWSDDTYGSLLSAWCMVFQVNPAALDKALPLTDSAKRALADALIQSLACVEQEAGDLPADQILDDGVEVGAVVDVGSGDDNDSIN